MTRFRHAVQLCTIAFVFITIHGHVLLAVNIKDFKNLADQFLSKTLANKLNQLVSESAKTTRRDDTKAGDQYPDLDLKKVADIIRAKLLNEDKKPPEPSTEKVTSSQKIKRFSTVKNTFTKQILRNQNYTKTSSGLEYVRDDLDKLLQSKPEEEANGDHKQLDYAGIRLNESEETIVSQEPSESKASFDMLREKHNENNSETHKKIDYTETKLGDWLYNHIISQKPVKLQNHKVANIDINDEGNTEELSDKSENVRNVQYVYQTHSIRPNSSSRQNVHNLEPLRPKNKDTGNVEDQVTDERGTSKEYIMGPKLNTIYKKKPQKKLIEENYPGSYTKDQEIENRQLMNKNEYVTPFQGNENTLNQENSGLDQGEGNLEESINDKMESSLYDVVEGKNHPIEEHITYDKYMLGSKDKDHLKELQGQPVRDKHMHENYKLGQKIKSSNNNSFDLQQPDDSDEKLMLEIKKTFDDESIASNINEANRSSNRDQLLLTFNDKSIASNINEGNKSSNRDQLLLRNKKRDPDIPENHYISDNKKGKSDSIKSKIESPLENTVEVEDQPKDEYITPIKDENDIQRKKTQKQPVEENDMYKKYKLGSETKSNKQARPLDDDYVFKQPTPGSKHEFDDDVSNIDDELSNRGRPILRSTNRESVTVATKSVKPLEDDYVFKKPTPGSKHEFDHDVSNIDTNIDDEFSNKPILRSTKRDNSVKVAKNEVITTEVSIKKENFDDDSLPDFQAVGLGSSSSDEIKNKQPEDHNTFNKYNLKKGPLKKTPKKQPIEENDMYEKYLLDSKDNDNEDREIKKGDDTYGYKAAALGKNNKDEENDMYDKYSLVSNDKNRKDRKVKKDDDEYGYKETISGKKNKEDYHVRDKNEENDMYDKYSPGSEDMYSKNREVKNDVNNRHKETYLGNNHKGDHRVRDNDEVNDMYDKYSPGSEDKYSKNREVKNDVNNRHKANYLGNNHKRDHRIRYKDEENDIYDKYSLGSKDKDSKGKEKKDDVKYGYKETVMGNNKKGDHRVRDKDEENDIYDKYSQGSKDKNSNDREVKNSDVKYGYKETFSGKKNNGDHRLHDKNEENDMYDEYSPSSKDKNSKDREVKKSDGKNGYKETFSGKKNNGDHRIRNKDEENDMYDKYSLGSKDKKSKDGDVEYDYKETFPGKKNKGAQRLRDKNQENDMYDKYSLGSKYKSDKRKEVIEDDDKYGHKETVFGKKYKGEHRVPDKDEKNDMYHKYSLGSKDKNRNSRDRKVKTQKETFTGQKNKEDRLGRDKDNWNNNEKNRHKLKVKEAKNDVPPEGYADDPRPDFKEVKPESIKAKTESLLDSVEDKRKPIKRFTMKGTLIPKREFYKLSSPNYYKHLPRIVDKYDFAEPLPERDRERDKVGYLRREPTRVNRKLKLPIFEKVI